MVSFLFFTKSILFESWKDYIALVRRIGSFKSPDGNVKGTSRSKHPKSQVCPEFLSSFLKKIRLLKFLYDIIIRHRLILFLDVCMCLGKPIIVYMEYNKYGFILHRRKSHLHVLVFQSL